MMEAIIHIAAIIAGAVLFRWRGMDKHVITAFPRPWPQALFALPYAVYTFMHAAIAAESAAVIVFILTWLAILTGRGGWQDLGDWIGARTNETLEFIIRPLRDRLPVFWYDLVGMCFAGCCITLPAGLATLSPLLALSGLLFAAGYVISRWADAHTEGGELLGGGLLWLSLSLIWMSA